MTDGAPDLHRSRALRNTFARIILAAVVVLPTLAAFACVRTKQVTPVDAAAPPVPSKTSARRPEEHVGASATATSSPESPEALEALEAARALEAGTILRAGSPMAPLRVAGFDDAIVSLPLGARGPRPVIVAAHGNYDRPEWQCETWRQMVRHDAFILCPRGAKRTDSLSRDDTRFTFASGDRFFAEVEAGLEALRAEWPGFVADGPLLMVGFSLGALNGARMATRVGGPAVSRAVLVEGGHQPWSAEATRAFVKKGGKRVLFACGQPSCTRDSERVRAMLERHDVAVRIVSAPKEGHSYGGVVAAKVAEQYAWLIEGDERFARDP